MKYLILLLLPLISFSQVEVPDEYWLDDSSYDVSIKPVISSAHMDTDTRILVIKGYGFSIVPSENKITYKYADENKTNQYDKYIP